MMRKRRKRHRRQSPLFRFNFFSLRSYHGGTDPGVSETLPKAICHSFAPKATGHTRPLHMQVESQYLSLLFLLLILNHRNARPADLTRGDWFLPCLMQIPFFPPLFHANSSQKGIAKNPEGMIPIREGINREKEQHFENDTGIHHELFLFSRPVTPSHHEPYPTPQRADGTMVAIKNSIFTGY